MLTAIKLRIASGSHAPAWEPIPQHNDSSVCIPTLEHGDETCFISLTYYSSEGNAPPLETITQLIFELCTPQNEHEPSDLHHVQVLMQADLTLKHPL